MILKAAWVVPVCSAPIRDGYVRVREDRIVACGACGALEAGDEEIVDLGGAILTPGLVNPHTHLELTCYAGRLEAGSFWRWLAGLVALRREAGAAEREGQAVVDGAWASLRGGVTCVGDISRRNIAWRALKAISIRKVCFVELLSIADDPPRNVEELGAAVAEVEEDGLLTVGISPHAPYTVPAEQIRGALELAAAMERPWCIHWCETREERSFLSGRADALPAFFSERMERVGVRATGESASVLLANCSGGCRPGALAHVNYVDDADIALLADGRHTVVYCPRTHAFFGHSEHPLRRLRDGGVTVAIGTDSAASSGNVSMLEEMRFLARLGLGLSDADIFRMATLDAARALGMQSEIGTLEAGKQADLAAFRAAGGQCDAPYAGVLSSGGEVQGVWVAGRRVV